MAPTTTPCWICWTRWCASRCWSPTGLRGGPGFRCWRRSASSPRNNSSPAVTAERKVRTAHARYFAEREADILALWDSPRQREAYSWLTVEMPNLRTAFRWAADHNDLDTAATIAHYAAFVGFWGEQHEPDPVGRGTHRTRARCPTPALGPALRYGGAVLHGRKDRRRRRLCRGRPGSRHQRTLRRSPQGRRSYDRQPILSHRTAWAVG